MYLKQAACHFVISIYEVFYMPMASGQYQLEVYANSSRYYHQHPNQLLISY